MDNEINILALVKGEEKFVFLFDDRNRVQTLRMLGRYAADPELSFTWYDAAILSQRIRAMSPAPSVVTSDSGSSSGFQTEPLAAAVKAKRPRF